MSKRILHVLFTVSAIGLLVTSVQADVISTDDGAVLTGVCGSGTEVTDVQAWVAAKGSNPVDATANLLQNHLSALPIYTGSLAYGSQLQNINDGLMVGNGGTDGDTANLTAFDTAGGNSLVFLLDAKYSIGKIDTFTNYANSRTGQKFDLYTSTDGGATWSPLTSVDIANQADTTIIAASPYVDNYIRRVSTTNSSNAAIATGVNALKFVFATPTAGSGIAVYSEIAAYAAVPEPSSITLLAVGLFGLLAYAWRKQK